MAKIKKNRIKSFMKNILIAIIVIIVIFAILELVTRLFFPQNLNYTMFDENLMFRHVPNLEFRYFWTEFDNKVRFNSKGLRDYEYPYEKANGTYRIMILGDSLPAALQVRLNETFPKVLEQKLRINSKIKRPNSRMYHFWAYDDHLFCRAI